MARRRALKDQLDLFALIDEEPPPPPMPSGLAAAVAVAPAPEPTLAPVVPIAPPAATPAKPRYRIPPLNPAKLAERVAYAWHSHYGGSDLDIPLGVVAALTLVRQRDPDGPSLEGQCLALDPAGLLEALREIWGVTWIAQPYLMEVAAPLRWWLNQGTDPSKEVMKAAHAVAQAAIKAGLLSITGDPDPMWRCQDDVLSRVLMELRSKGSRDALGEFHTPTSLSDAMAKMLLQPDSITPGMRICEPAAGTGGMVRAAALALRELNYNPHDFHWVMGELNPTAAACAAVNSLVWDLGPNVLIHVGDTLAVGDIELAAVEHRKAVYEHHEHLMGVAAMAAAVKQANDLLNQVTAAA
ncbi:N-6 DNA methylase [Microtetraspora malaysiensis]|uniref:N-6 DNA methylase n=1 Tax=Microtetraspora malaysiensis TaxID=161358 RepID=UPI003D8B70B4